VGVRFVQCAEQVGLGSIRLDGDQAADLGVARRGVRDSEERAVVVVGLHLDGDRRDGDAELMYPSGTPSSENFD